MHCKWFTFSCHCVREWIKVISVWWSMVPTCRMLQCSPTTRRRFNSHTEFVRASMFKLLLEYWGRCRWSPVTQVKPEVDHANNARGLMLRPTAARCGTLVHQCESLESKITMYMYNGKQNEYREWHAASKWHALLTRVPCILRSGTKQTSYISWTLRPTYFYSRLRLTFLHNWNRAAPAHVLEH